MPHQDPAELEEALVLAHDQVQEDNESLLQKILAAKPGQGLTQAFFILAQAICMIDSDTLQNWPTPWFHRMIRIASNIDPATLSIAGDDLLKADEREEFSLFVQRASMIYPRTVLILIRSIFSMEKMTEIRFDLEEEEEITLDVLKTYITPLKSLSLQRYRDKLIGNLSLEWVDYGWKESFLLASMISEHELQAKTVYKLVRKSIDYYPEDQNSICNKAYTMIQKLKISRTKTTSMVETAIKLANSDPSKALDIAIGMDSMDKRIEILERIVQSFDWDKGLAFVKQIPLPKFKTVCLRGMLCKLPGESEQRISYIEKIWEIAQTIREESLKVEIIKNIVRIGIREQDIAKEMARINNLLLEMWENCSKMPSNMSLDIICNTFPAFMKILDEDSTTNLFKNLYDPENFPIKIGSANYKTVVF